MRSCSGDGDHRVIRLRAGVVAAGRARVAPARNDAGSTAQADAPFQ
jgi:hypothetical protein